MKVSLFEVSYKKLTFSPYSNFVYIYIYIYIYIVCVCVCVCVCVFCSFLFTVVVSEIYMLVQKHELTLRVVRPIVTTEQM